MDIEELPLRECLCTFCARHQPRYTSDPDGRLEIRLDSPDQLIRYRFGLGLADFLICARCGVYIGAVRHDDDGMRGVLNVNVLDRASEFGVTAQAMDFDAEDSVGRSDRHRARWTPAVISS